MSNGDIQRIDTITNSQVAQNVSGDMIYNNVIYNITPLLDLTFVYNEQLELINDVEIEQILKLSNLSLLQYNNIKITLTVDGKSNYKKEIYQIKLTLCSKFKDVTDENKNIKISDFIYTVYNLIRLDDFIFSKENYKYELPYNLLSKVKDRVGKYFLQYKLTNNYLPPFEDIDELDVNLFYKENNDINFIEFFGYKYDKPFSKCKFQDIILRLEDTVGFYLDSYRNHNIEILDFYLDTEFVNDDIDILLTWLTTSDIQCNLLDYILGYKPKSIFDIFHAAIGDGYFSGEDIQEWYNAENKYIFLIENLY